MSNYRSVNLVRAGNMLNDAMVSPEISLAGRIALWLTYHGLMALLSKELDKFERSVAKRYEPVPERETDPNWTPAKVSR